MWPTWDPPGSCRPQVDPTLVPWTLLSGNGNVSRVQIVSYEVHTTCGNWSAHLDGWDQGSVSCEVLTRRGNISRIAKFMWPIWGPPGSCRPQVDPTWPHDPCCKGTELFTWMAETRVYIVIYEVRTTRGNRSAHLDGWDQGPDEEGDQGWDEEH